MINNVLPLVLQALGNPELSISSVSTLKKICRECKYDLPPYAANIVAVSQDVLMKQIHKTSQCMWLMQALGFLLSALQVEEILKNLHSLITPYIQQLEKLADETPNPSNKLLVHIFAHEPAHFPPIKALFLLVTSVTLTLFQQGPRDHPDIVDSFMQLLAQALKRKPDLFFCSSLDVQAVFQCGILSLKFPEALTVKASCGFFTELLPRCGEVPPVGQVVHENGKQLLQAVLEGIGGQASRSLMDHFAEILFALSKHCFSYLSVWMKAAMQQEGFPSARLSPEQKDTFSQQILSRERVNKRRVKEMVKEFTLLCRGLHGTEYTADY
uniref:Importin 13 n=1 Tax=Chelonoidis abingdonii TaxID=106734 RepID=A0A8C0GV65_CHEAB